MKSLLKHRLAWPVTALAALLLLNQVFRPDFLSLRMQDGHRRGDCSPAAGARTEALSAIWLSAGCEQCPCLVEQLGGIERLVQRIDARDAQALERGDELLPHKRDALNERLGTRTGTDFERAYRAFVEKRRPEFEGN